MADNMSNLARNVSHVADEVNNMSESVDEIANDVNEISNDVKNSTRLLNECIKEHLGVPLLNDWYQWGMDILYNRVPADSDFFRPSNLGEWLRPQYVMMLISYGFCHVLSFIDARLGSKISKKFGFKQSALVKVRYLKSETKSDEFVGLEYLRLYRKFYFYTLATLTQPFHFCNKLSRLKANPFLMY